MASRSRACFTKTERCVAYNWDGKYFYSTEAVKQNQKNHIGAVKGDT